MALACCRASTAMTIGFSAIMAGAKNAPAPDVTAARPHRSGIEGSPAANMTAMPPTATRRTRSEPTITRCGCSRSAQTPPNSVPASVASTEDAITRPSAPGPPPLVTTATARATVWKPLPSQDRA